MREIDGKAKTVRDILAGARFKIDYYQRDYRWGKQQAVELVNDLTSKFLQEFDPDHSRKQVAGYPPYFLGSFIVSAKDDGRYIVDGQQRLTSLTLLFVFLRRLQADVPGAVAVDDLVYSVRYGEASFNIDVEERRPCMQALLAGVPFDASEKSESVRNLVGRFADMEEAWPDEIRGAALPFFVDWLLDNVRLVEITAYTDDDAYTIFETMNDRGLSLSPTDMLKGFLLASVESEKDRQAANEEWRSRVRQLSDLGKEVEADFFKTWLRSRYATRIRERKRNARAEDFDRMGTEYHRWLRESALDIGLRRSEDFLAFIRREFDFYARVYIRIHDASRRPTPGLEDVYFNAQHGFTLQYLLALAPVLPEDDQKTVDLKIAIVARYVNIMLAWRLWNFRSIAYSTMQYSMFLVMRDIRGLAPEPLAQRLLEQLSKETETFASNERLRVHQQNRYAIHRLLAQMTDFVERASGMPSRYHEYVAEGRSRFEVEHVIANHYERYENEFASASDFSESRNRIGGLLLLPKSFNASYGDLVYEEKREHYRTQNLLAHSLHPDCYRHNPGFVRFVRESGLPFQSHDRFGAAELEARSRLYAALAEAIWRPSSLLEIAKSV